MEASAAPEAEPAPQPGTSTAQGEPDTQRPSEQAHQAAQRPRSMDGQGERATTVDSPRVPENPKAGASVQLSNSKDWQTEKPAVDPSGTQSAKPGV